ncbi:MAG TPA: S41 family peptidase [Armatimonadota bacterium]|jgi:tricorn protease
MLRRSWVTLALACLLLCASVPSWSVSGYYRFPALHGDSVVFTAQGDLWEASAKGGPARSITSHPGVEAHAALSPDGSQLAYTASYEGPAEAYVMPTEGGLPTRLTYLGGATVVGWTPDGKVLYTTQAYSTLPDTQMVAIDPKTRESTVLPLRQASDGCYDKAGGTLFFTRLPFQGSHTKRYQGGTVQQIWRLEPGAKEAQPLTADFKGTSKNPMWWDGRVYFLTDRDGTMNLWSMKPDGKDRKQLTHHTQWDIQSASLDAGRVVYQLGADLHLYDIASGADTTLDISLTSDLDQTRERWITRPLDYLTAARPSPEGDKVVLTARGQVFVAPATQGRFVQVTRKSGVRYRQAQFAPDGKSILALSDETGETEWWRLPVNGIGDAERLSTTVKALVLQGAPSPDGKWIAYSDKNQDLWLLDPKEHRSTRIDTSEDGEFGDLKWSPDSRWLAYVKPSLTFARIWLYSVKDQKSVPITTDRADSSSPVFTPDGKWLYFLSDRTFRSMVGGPWGPRQPEPYFDKQTKIYQLALQKGLRSPFDPADELHLAADEKKASEAKEEPKGDTKSKEPNKDAKESKDAKPALEIEGVMERLREVPVPAGNYESLSATKDRLLWISRESGYERKPSLQTLEVTNVDPSAKTVLDDVGAYEVTADGKKMWLRKGSDSYVIDSNAGPGVSLDKKGVNLSGWAFPLVPRDEWRQMITEAWRLERDYFYDRNMHGLDWPAVLKQYLPLADRVTDRDELADLMAQMVSELSALHTFVNPGDTRRGQESITPAALGAELVRDGSRGGYRVERVYQGDPDYPEGLSPLAKQGVDVEPGDTILSVNGVAALTAPDLGALLRNLAGKQTLLRVKSGKTGRERDVVAVPLSSGAAWNLRYSDWELSRRKLVDQWSGGAIGYVHLRAMGDGDIAQWAKDFYPVFARQGLIVDVRHNGGGNIDSWILEKLMRRPWFYWQSRVGAPTWNMQWAFRGHMVVLCDEGTASDGEAFAEGFRRLGLGKVIGTRTWGGEIWLSFSNTLVDNGIASAAEFGVYGPEGAWLIEGHGVEPDIEVDNLPRASFLGEDAQLKAGVDQLLKMIREKPVRTPPPPRYPSKRWPPEEKTAAPPQ